jgi:UDP-N-acetylmuramate dehydrogenase
MMLLSQFTTLGLGGPAKSFVTATTDDELISAVRAADEDGDPALILGGGSNLVVGDAGFPGTVVHVATRGVTYDRVSGDSVTRHSGPGLVEVAVAAGEGWDDVVAATVADGLAGLECLSGIPGRAGATPIQNVGAYGQEVAEVITGVRVLDRQAGTVSDLSAPQCQFAYRTSMFKQAPHPSGHGSRYVVLAVTFGLHDGKLSRPVRYAELARELGAEIGDQVPCADARAAVLTIRGRKGMVISPDDPDSRSAGSFFTNPVLGADQLAHVEAVAQARGIGPVPRFEQGSGLVKVPAAWLIERSGFTKGYGTPGPAHVSTKHTLALVNAGNATAADLLALAREIIEGVRAAFGVTLEPEPILVGVTL